jgi:hypothetical protein
VYVIYCSVKGRFEIFDLVIGESVKITVCENIGPFPVFAAMNESIITGLNLIAKKVKVKNQFLFTVELNNRIR